MAKSKLNLKDFDFKQFLLEKGERVGLWVAVGVMALLFVGGVLKSLGASPSKNRDEIATVTKQKQTALANSTLPPDKNQVPSDLIAAVNPKDVAADAFALAHPWFTPSDLDDTKWRRPEILPIGVATAQIVFSQVAKWGFDPSKDTVLVRSSVSNASDDDKQKRFEKGLDKDLAKRLRRDRRQQQRLQQLLQRGGGGGGMRGGMMGGGMMGGGMMGGGMMGGGGMRGGMMGGGMMGGAGGSMNMRERMRMMQNPGSGMGGNGGGDKWKLETASLEDALKKNLTPARVAVPITEAVICAEFPYKNQMDAIRKALRYPSIEAMLSDPKVWTQKDDPQHPPTINFLGFRVERQAIGPDGRVVQPWAEIDLEAPYREVWRYCDNNVKSASDSEADLLQNGLIISDVPSRLVWGLPPLMPKDLKYADAVAHLPDLKKALDEAKKDNKPKDSDTAPKNPYDSDPFQVGGDSGGPSPTPNGGAAGPTLPPSGAGGSGNMANQMKMMQQRMQKMGARPGSGPTGPSMPPNMMKGGFGKGGGSMAGGAGESHKLPDWCLIRFIDVTIHPGLTYQYRVQLRLANPLYNRKEQALSEEMTKQKEIFGPEKPHLLMTLKDGQTVPLSIHVPAETSVYCVDEKPSGRRGGVVPADNNRVAVQIHRWLDTLQTNDISRVPVGEWAIAERELAHRGEYLGQSERVEVPVWSPQEDKYLFANPTDGNKHRGRRHKGAIVNFSTDALLVDFQGGKKLTTVGDKAVADTLPVEMLVMTSDGRLIVRNSALDSVDKARKDRLDEWKKRQKDVKDALDQDNNNGQNGGSKSNPFNGGMLPGGKR